MRRRRGWWLIAVRPNKRSALLPPSIEWLSGPFLCHAEAFSSATAIYACRDGLLRGLAAVLVDDEGDIVQVQHP